MAPSGPDEVKKNLAQGPDSVLEPGFQPPNRLIDSPKQHSLDHNVHTHYT